VNTTRPSSMYEAASAYANSSNLQAYQAAEESDVSDCSPVRGALLLQGSITAAAFAITAEPTRLGNRDWLHHRTDLLLSIACIMRLIQPPTLPPILLRCCV
jgi:hypothetical protein